MTPGVGWIDARQVAGTKPAFIRIEGKIVTGVTDSSGSSAEKNAWTLTSTNTQDPSSDRKTTSPASGTNPAIDSFCFEIKRSFAGDSSEPNTDIVIDKSKTLYFNDVVLTKACPTAAELLSPGYDIEDNYNF